MAQIHHAVWIQQSNKASDQRAAIEERNGKCRNRENGKETKTRGAAEGSWKEINRQRTMF